MGLIDGLLGHASEVDNEKIEKIVGQLLADNENVEKAYRFIRDLFIFTNGRLILIDKQGVTGKKVEYLSIPYKSITHFCVESAGHFDLDADFKIWISGVEMPIKKEFKKDKNIFDVQKTLASYVCQY